MAEVTLTDQSVQEKSTAELHPTRTTPQGTQEQGVERGHEHRDMNIGAVLKWFFSLAVVVALSFAGLSLMFSLLAARETRNDVSPGPMFVARPRLAADQPQLLPDPGQHLQEFRQDEREKMTKMGMENANGDAIMPNREMAAVAKENPSGAATPGMGNAATAPDATPEMPGGPSGGTMMGRSE